MSTKPPSRVHTAAVETNADTSAVHADYPTIEQLVGNTPLVRLQRLPGKTSNVILCKLEGNNPAGSVKDRPALSMIQQAESSGRIKPGDTLIEATSGNTGIALAMVAAMKGYKLTLIMPSNMSQERRDAMAAYGAQLLSVPAGAMEMARDLAMQMQANGEGIVLNQFGNFDNPRAHFMGTGPEIWEQTRGRVTHFVSSMGTTGTIMGTSQYLKEMNPNIEIVGLQPKEGASIAGIRRWPVEYLPEIFDAARVDCTMDIGQEEAEETTRALARMEGIFCGVSSGGAISAALQLSEEVENATIVAIVCDRGDRYLSTGVYSQPDTPPPTDVQGLKTQLQRLMGVPNLYVLFTSGDDPDTKLPWCPDCVRANPAVAAAFAAVEGATLLVCKVGDRPSWKSVEHPLRVDERTRLSCIPTLVQWDAAEEGGGPLPGRRLDTQLEACETEEQVTVLVGEMLLSS